MRQPNVFSIATLVAAAFVGSVLVTACGGSSDRRFPLKGQILSIAASGTEASIKHEAIPNFMAAMTMTYSVKDAAEYASLKPGDLIEATLVVEQNGAYLTGVKRVGEAPLETPAPAPSASSGFETLKPGEMVPAGTFVDQNGKPRSFDAFHGSTVVLTFIYTSCPMPTFCPMMDRHFVTLQEKLKSEPALKNVQLVSVSFDPITDTPAVLTAHAKELGADLSRWTFLTGDRDEIDQFAMRFGMSVTRSQTDPLDISHNLRTAIIDPEGHLEKIYTGNTWTPDEVLADLRKGASAN